MSKIIKIVAAVGLIVAGVATGNFQLVAAGLTIGASALKGSPKNRPSPENFDRLRASLDPRTPRKTVVGVTALATDIRDEEFTDNQTYFHRFIVVASHKVNAIEEIWFDDKVAWTSAGGVQGEFAGYLTVATRTEGSAANAINISARMGSTRRYTGLAYVHLRYKLTGNSKKVESPFAQSITTRITIRGEGAALYDPRSDSTVPGGSGTHRADDQATWTWDEDSARNPALQLLFYLLGYRINGLLAVGKGIPPDRIDLESFAVAANICDELVTTEDAGTEPRYRSDGVWSEADSPTTVIDMLKATMNADLDDVGGKLRLTIFHNDLATPAADFTDDDIIDAFEWQAQPPIDQTFNVVRGVYTDPSDTSLYQQVDYPSAETTSPDGIERPTSFDLPMVQSPDQAQRLATLRLNRVVHGGGTFSATFQATAWKVQKNSIVRLTFAPTGFVNKLFRVAEMEIRQDGTVPMILREESASIYGVPSLQPVAEPIASTPWDYLKSPLYLGFTTAARTIRSKTVAFPLTSDANSIDVTAFSGVLSDGSSLSFPADTTTLVSLSASTIYGVFYNPTTTTYSAAAEPATAQFGNDALVFIGWQATEDGAGTFPAPPTAPGGAGGDGGYYFPREVAP